MSKKQKEALGKGIRALLEGMDDDASSGGLAQVGTVVRIPLALIEVNPFQPRNEFDAEKLDELSESIRAHGVIQPVTVRRIGDSKFQLIAGERRLRASKLAGLEEIPAYVRTANDQESLEIALIENIQREDLNALEIGINYQRLLDECDLTHEELSARLGKKRATITNYLRLLKLPPVIQQAIQEHRLSMGHARALAGVDDAEVQLAIFQEVLSGGLSVRQTENLVKRYASSGSRPRKKEAKSLPYGYRTLQDGLSSELGTKVSIKPKKNGSGEIVIYFHDEDDLERLHERLNG